MSKQIVWFRRDLRLGDHPALCAAAESGPVLPLFVLDPQLVDRAGVREPRLLASLAALREATGGALVVRSGDPAQVVAEVAREIGAAGVHVSAETTPFGRRRDEAVTRTLTEHDLEWTETGSPYAVTPGRIRNGQGNPYRVFTPYSRSWREHGWRRPAELGEVEWVTGVDSEGITPPDGVTDAGEEAAAERWAEFLEHDLATYADDRDRADLDSTSRMSIPLKWGEIHPRTLLADLTDLRGTADDDAIDRFVTEVAWRDFYADVLWHDPGSAWRDWSDALTGMRYDDDADLLEAWCQGRTGFPFVDAGMRQLLAEGWMHNRVRMVTASFLVKDLHLWWPAGARHFLAHLRDGDIASNNHGWQWVAGTGTDAAPYFRIFNPITQGQRFDPDGDYVRRWVPELRHLPGKAVHEPWRHDDGYAEGYPEPIVDHAEERKDALARLEQTKGDR